MEGQFKKAFLKFFLVNVLVFLGPNGCGKTTYFQCALENRNDMEKFILKINQLNKYHSFKIKEGLVIFLNKEVFLICRYDNILGIAQIH